MNRSLRIALIAGLVAMMLPVVPSASSTVAIPETLHGRISLGDSEVATSKLRSLPFPATHLGFDWRGTELGPEVRTSQDGTSWSPWESVPVSEDVSDHDAGTYFSSLVPGDRARWVQIRNAPESQVHAVRVSAINVRDGPLRMVRIERGARAATPQPNIISRSAWGANESLRSGTPRFARVRKLFVHHTVTANNDPDPRGTIRAIYAYHTQSRGFSDIAYNFLIDWDGNVYEGRYARTYDAGEIPNGEDRNGKGVIGAHVGNHNTGSVGVALLGDFRSTPPPSAGVGSLVELLAWKADRHGINPFGSEPYFNLATGGWETFPNIAGHRDAGITACPGDTLYGALPQVRQDAENRIQATTASTAPAMPTGTELSPPSPSYDFTPNAIGNVSHTAVRVELTFDGAGLLSDRTFTLTPSAGTFLLTDDDYRGLPLQEGHYEVRAVAYDSQARASPVAPVSADFIVERLTIGYWLAAGDGGIFTFGNKVFYGSMGGKPLAAPVVGMAAAPSGIGYRLVAADGGVFAFGDAPYLGGMAGRPLAAPIGGMAATPSGNGYWLVAGDGGIFAFGDAPYLGGMAGRPLAKPVVGMAATPSGNGYWLVAADGGLFAFGDAQYLGGMAGRPLAKPVVGIASTPSGNGYWLVAGDGGVFAFGDARYLGGMGGKPMAKSVVGMAVTPSGNGYWLVAGDGGVFAFGDARFLGNMAGQPLAAPVVAIGA